MEASNQPRAEMMSGKGRAVKIQKKENPCNWERRGAHIIEEGGECVKVLVV